MSLIYRNLSFPWLQTRICKKAALAYKLNVFEGVQ